MLPVRILRLDRTSMSTIDPATRARQLLPPPFVARLAQIIEAYQLNRVLASFAEEKRFSFRINGLVGSAEETLVQVRQLGVDYEPVPWLVDEQVSPIAFVADRIWRERLTHSDLIEQGRVYLQNLSSMIAPWILGAAPEETVLDLAAAPGGKTIQLAQQMKNTGQLSAVEAVRNRMFKLQANLMRCNVTNCKTYFTDGRTVGQKTPERFDRVLLDAPCSSESRFRVDEPASWETWSLGKIRETSRKQIGLLKAAIHAAKIGGTILYCTCSFAPEENEQVVDKAIRKFGDAIEIVPFEIPFCHLQSGLTKWGEQTFDDRLAHTRRILPDAVFDAFYLAKIVKTKSVGNQKNGKRMG
jgi:16S rRNA (cytosine1407-C5)-methyltransferase